jgi:hypothetical protein
VSPSTSGSARRPTPASGAGPTEVDGGPSGLRPAQAVVPAAFAPSVGAGQPWTDLPSVVVAGRARRLHTREAAALPDDLLPEVRACGPRSSAIAIEPTRVEGRRLT